MTTKASILSKQIADHLSILRYALWCKFYGDYISTKAFRKTKRKKNGIVYNLLFTCFLTPAFSFLIVFARRRLLIVLGAMGILGRVIAGHTPFTTNGNKTSAVAVRCYWIFNFRLDVNEWSMGDSLGFVGDKTSDV